MGSTLQPHPPSHSGFDPTMWGQGAGDWSSCPRPLPLLRRCTFKSATWERFPCEALRSGTIQC